MKTFIEGNGVFVADDDFVDLQSSPAVFGSCNDFCAAAAAGMIANGANSHVSFIDAPDIETTHLKDEGPIIKVTIEFVDRAESLVK
jgi:hypothetical protein